MANKIIYEPSRTLLEFRLLPGLTAKDCSAEAVSLKTPFVYSAGGEKKYTLNIPMVAAAMQSVSGERMGIELARKGGAAFIYCSQTIASQTDMIKKIKNYKAGFVTPETIMPDMKIEELQKQSERTGYSIFPIVDENNRLLGMIGRNDYDVSIHGGMNVSERMIRREKIEAGVDLSDLKAANALLIESHQPVLPVVDHEDRLLYLVFRKDIRGHLDNPFELVDENKRLIAAAAINTHDFCDRVPALVEAGVDVVAIDSSDGHSAFQEDAIRWIGSNYPSLPVIGGNVVTASGFLFLAECGAAAVKVGMGSGSICITQEQKGTGRGLATAVIEACSARDAFFEKTGKYIPVAADGGINTAKDIVMALALGADYVMMGRYFARMEESPTEKLEINNRIMKPYWGEGSARAREWKSIRYYQAKFVEGVEGFVEYAGKLDNNLPETVAKIKSSMSTAGARSVGELHRVAEVELVSALSIREGMAHDIYMPGSASEQQI
jgi:IMP dehydrogenase